MWLIVLVQNNGCLLQILLLQILLFNTKTYYIVQMYVCRHILYVFSFFVCIFCVCVFTWQGRSQAMRGPAGGDAPHNAVKQEADLFSLWTGQEKNTSPWKMDGERERCLWWMTWKKLGKWNNHQIKRHEAKAGTNAVVNGEIWSKIKFMSKAKQYSVRFRRLLWRQGCSLSQQQPFLLKVTQNIAQFSPHSPIKPTKMQEPVKNTRQADKNHEASKSHIARDTK